MKDESFERALRSDKEESPGSVVYFVRESLRGAIKIGVSKHVKKRAKELGYGMPYTVTVLAVTEGGRGVEALLHMRFSHARIKGEWFHPVPELLEYIEKHCEPLEAMLERELEALFEKRRNMRVIA